MSDYVDDDEVTSMATPEYQGELFEADHAHDPAGPARPDLELEVELSRALRRLIIARGLDVYEL